MPFIKIIFILFIFTKILLLIIIIYFNIVIYLSEQKTLCHTLKLIFTIKHVTTAVLVVMLYSNSFCHDCKLEKHIYQYNPEHHKIGNVPISIPIHFHSIWQWNAIRSRSCYDTIPLPLIFLRF